MRLPFLAIFLTLALVASSLTADASCLVPNVKVGFEQAKAVFIGQVEDIISPRSNNAGGEFFDRAHIVKFKIERSWKGPVFGSVTVWALQGNEISALPRISKGERYLVYADAVFSNEVATDQLLVSACNRTALLPFKVKSRLRFMELAVDREDGTKDVRALDSLLLESW